MDTHVLVLVPKAVNVNNSVTPISLESLGELVKAPKGGHSTKYDGFYAKEHTNTPVAESHWVLMKKEILPGSRKKPFSDQQDMVKAYSQTAGVQYEVPHAIDAAACCFLTFVSSGTRLFDYDHNHAESLTYTRCQEKIDGKWTLVVGGFAPDGLSVSNYRFDYPFPYVGVGAARKF